MSTNNLLNQPSANTTTGTSFDRREGTTHIRRRLAAMTALAVLVMGAAACGPDETGPADAGNDVATDSTSPDVDDDTGTVTGTATPEVEPAASGEYMVTINGFWVTSETWDHAFEVDGKGDEVYLSTGTKVLDASGNPVLDVQGGGLVSRSKVMGDTNQQNNRLACGSRSPAGGIRSGDWCMIERPWELDGIGPQSDRPPMKVIQTTLVDGQNSLVVSPTIWEWDGGADAYTEWTTFFRDAVNKVPPPAAGGTGAIVLTASKIGLELALAAAPIIGQAGDRPIGIQEQSGASMKFDPYVITLDYQAAEWLVNNDPSGKGKGVLELHYKDADKYRGDYSVYLQVTKLA